MELALALCGLILPAESTGMSGGGYGESCFCGCDKISENKWEIYSE